MKKCLIIFLTHLWGSNIIKSIVFEAKDLFIVFSVIIPYIFLFLLNYYILRKNKSIHKENIYYYLAISILFYIVFTFPFMYFNIFIAIVVYFIILLFFVVFTSRKKNLGKTEHTRKQINLFKLSIGVLLATLSLVEMFWDSIFHISPNFPDTYYNWIWIKANLNSEGWVHYFPGLSILGALPATLISPESSLNIYAASLGVVIIVIINLILRSTLSFYGLVIFNIILISPFYYPLLFTRVSLNNSQLFPLIYFALIVFLLDNFKNKSEINKLIFVLLLISAGITAPHILFLVLPSLFVATILLVIILRKSKRILFYFVVLFPISIFFSSLYSSSNNILLSIEPNAINNSLFSKLINLLIEYLRIKFPIRPPFESLNSLATYLIICGALVVFYVSVKNKYINLIFVSTLTIVLGITLQTGIAEFSMLKGRSGWYFMYSVAFLFALVFDKIFNKFNRIGKEKISNTFVVFLIIINLFSFIIKPPKAYREIDESVFINFKSILISDSKSEIKIYTDVEDISMVSSKLSVVNNFNYNLSNLDYIVLNFSKDLPDINLANLRNYEDRNYDNFNQNQITRIQRRIDLNMKITSMALDNNYRIVEQNDKIVILKNLRYG